MLNVVRNRMSKTDEIASRDLEVDALHWLIGDPLNMTVSLPAGASRVNLIVKGTVDCSPQGTGRGGRGLAGGFQKFVGLDD